jgi:hypothetical protein
MKLGMDGFVVIDQYFPELSPLDLEFSWKFLFSRHILDYFFGYWNETWYDCLQWWVTDQIWVLLLLMNICPNYGPLDLEFSWKFLFSGHILDYFFGYWNNLVWLFTMMSYRSSLSFVVIDQYLTKLWALGLWIFMKFSVFRTFFGLIFQILKWN